MLLLLYRCIKPTVPNVCAVCLLHQRKLPPQIDLLQPGSLRPERGCRLTQNLLSHRFAHRQSLEFLKISFDVRNTRARPVGAKQCFVGDLVEARKIRQQRLRRNSADVEIDVRVAGDEKNAVCIHNGRPPWASRILSLGKSTATSSI